MRSVRAGHWRNARNILCVRLDNLGDVLMSTPAIHALKRAASDRRITLLTSASGSAAVPLIPDIDELLVFDAPWVKHPAAPLAADYVRMCDELRSRRFDAAVIFTVYSQSALPAATLCFLAGIPLRLAHCRENPYHLLTDWVKESEPQSRIRHEVRRQLDLVATVGARPHDTRMRFNVPPAAAQKVRHLVKTSHADADLPLIVVHPGASAASRRYPPERFAEVVRMLAARRDCRLAVTGGAEERELVRQLCVDDEGRRRALDFAGRLDLAEFGALIARADLLISNNTGPVHIAAAVGTPVVDLYALTNPQHTPWRVPHRVLNRDVPCRFCYSSTCSNNHHGCLTGVQPDEIVDAALQLLAARNVAREPQVING